MKKRQHDGITAKLTDKDWAVLMEDFHGAIAQFELGIRVKFAWMSVLPWKLMALANPDKERAAEQAEKLVGMWEGVPDKQHHRKSRKFLHPDGVLRKDVDALIRTGEMPPLLEFNVLPFFTLYHSTMQPSRGSICRWPPTHG